VRTRGPPPSVRRSVVQSCDRGSAFPTSAANLASSSPSTRKYLPSPACAGINVAVTRAPEWRPTPDLLTVAASVCCGRLVGFQDKAARETNLRARAAAEDMATAGQRAATEALLGSF